MYVYKYMCGYVPEPDDHCLLRIHEGLGSRSLDVLICKEISTLAKEGMEERQVGHPNVY